MVFSIVGYVFSLASSFGLFANFRFAFIFAQFVGCCIVCVGCCFVGVLLLFVVCFEFCLGV